MIRLLVLCVLALLPLRGNEDRLKSQAETPPPVVKGSAANAYRILFIGDSITLHGTSDAIKETLGWGHLAGMAASSMKTDYVHVLAAKIQETMPDRKVEIYYDSQGNSPVKHAFKPGSAAAKYATIDAARVFVPHLVVIQLGEHEEARRGEAFLVESYTQLVTAFDRQSPRPLVLCTGVWVPGDARAGDDRYESGWAGVIERTMREVAERHGAFFASVRAYALDPTCRGWGSTSGVQWHPNDKGMAGYAHELFNAFKQANVRKEPVALRLEERK